MDELGKRPGVSPGGRFFVALSSGRLRDTHTMNAITPSGDAETVDAALDDVVCAVDYAIARFRQKMDEIAELDSTTQDAVVQRAMTRLKEQFGILISFRTFLTGKRDGKFSLSAATIDFDDARAEIGRLLDRIRDAGASGSLLE